MPRYLALILLLGTAGGCASVTSPAPKNELASTNWTLIDFRASADTAPTEVGLNRYSLSFGADGRVTMKLDCNRGTSSWKATSTATRVGTLTLGPIAATRALCPDAGVGETLARDLTGSWPYALDDGRLTINTAGTAYTFEVID